MQLFIPIPKGLPQIKSFQKASDLWRMNLLTGLKHQATLFCWINKSQLTERERKKVQLHKVFKGSFDDKATANQNFLLLKIQHTHNNPDSGKWMLAEDFTAHKPLCVFSAFIFYYTRQAVRYN
mgnify:CR=1 FL=1